MKNCGLFISLFFFSIANAQVSDNFQDGDFTANPVWSGSLNQFIINASQQVQLNNTVAGLSYLSTSLEVPSLNNFEWHAWVRQNFSPSSSNFGRVYLVSNHADLTQSLNGYYLQFGESGSNDAIELFRQTGSTSTSVCRGTNGSIATSFLLRIKVLRDDVGLWKLFVDYTGGTNFRLEATGIDSALQSSSFFGISCTYTSSNATKFFYDDFYAGPIVQDTISPVLQAVHVLSANTVELTFSEALDKRSAELVENYSVNNSLGTPQTALLSADPRTVILTFRANFLNGITNQLTILGIADLAGNTMIISKLNFIFFHPIPANPKDIIISEILPDPSPSIGLPDAEFMELYNRSANPFDLSGWKLSDKTITGIFSALILLPEKYLIVASSAAASQFNAFGNVAGLQDFPSLNNDGDNLILQSPEGITIDSLTYTPEWYHDVDKEEGGWSLEIIDLQNPCGEEDNWTASEDPKGGTPGKQNSVNASKPDLTGPKLVSVVPIQPNQLELTWDEKLDKSSPKQGSFLITPSISFSRAHFADQTLRKIQLDLAANLQPGQLYRLKVQNVRDCNGNLSEEEFSQHGFALPEEADSLDIVINEILFNPRPGGVDFVEVYNNSSKFIDLNNWKLSNIENGVPENVELITSTDFILSPRSYLALTSDPGILKNNYPQGVETNFFRTSVPSLPDDYGSIALLSDRGKIIDYFLYTKSLHSPLIKDDEGVSLERISFSHPTNVPQNWRSASSSSGWATPGYLNSNAQPENPSSRGKVTVEPEIFAPTTGVQDFAKINYSFERTGFVANIEIIDFQGHLIKTIANNETLGYEGFFRWDGDRDDGSKARIGYYLVRMEVFDVTGTVNTFRKRIVITNR